MLDKKILEQKFQSNMLMQDATYQEQQIEELKERNKTLENQLKQLSLKNYNEEYAFEIAALKTTCETLQNRLMQET